MSLPLPRRTARKSRDASVARWLAPLGLLLMAACTEQVDESIFEAERAKPIQRSDMAIAAASNETAAIVGMQSGVVVKSTDGGASWQRIALKGASIIDMDTCADGSFLALDFYRKVWSADSNGAEWTSASFEHPETALVVRCDPKGRWWIAGTRSRLSVSSDKGKSWTETDLGEDAQITTLSWIDGERAIATGEFGMVLATTDSGATWRKIGSLGEAFYPFDSHFTSPVQGYVTGVAGQVQQTADGGRTWRPMENATGSPLYRIVDMAGALYGVGAAGTVARLEGDAWQPVAYPDATPAFLAAAAAVKPGVKTLLVGGPGGLVRTIALQDQ